MLQNYYKIVNFRNNWVLEVSRQARYLGRTPRAYTRIGKLRAASCELGPYAREASCKMLGGEHLTQ